MADNPPTSAVLTTCGLISPVKSNAPSLVKARTSLIRSAPQAVATSRSRQCSPQIRVAPSSRCTSLSFKPNPPTAFSPGFCLQTLCTISHISKKILGLTALFVYVSRIFIKRSTYHIIRYFSVNIMTARRLYYFDFADFCKIPAMPVNFFFSQYRDSCSAGPVAATPASASNEQNTAVTWMLNNT